MFERWTERARQVAVLAQEEARALGHPQIGTEHLLLGLSREEDSLAARTLGELGLETTTIRERVEQRSPRTEPKPRGQIPFTERAAGVCEMALREALSLGNNYIGTEHLLLALVRENGGDGAKILLELDADAEKVRGIVMREMRPARTEPALPGTRLDQRIIDALPDLRRAAGKLQGNAEIVVRTATRNGVETKPLVVIRRGPDGQGRLYVTGEVLGQ